MVQIGDRVRKVGGDYKFEGVVVSIFAKRSGIQRCVVEDDRGVLFIFNEKQLEMVEVGATQPPPVTSGTVGPIQLHDYVLRIL
jgi:hypothetical protein